MEGTRNEVYDSIQKHWPPAGCVIPYTISARSTPFVYRKQYIVLKRGAINSYSESILNWLSEYFNGYSDRTSLDAHYKLSGCVICAISMCYKETRLPRTKKRRGLWDIHSIYNEKYTYICSIQVYTFIEMVDLRVLKYIVCTQINIFSYCNK